MYSPLYSPDGLDASCAQEEMAMRPNEMNSAGLWSAGDRATGMSRFLSTTQILIILFVWFAWCHAIGRCLGRVRIYTLCDWLHHTSPYNLLILQPTCVKNGQHAHQLSHSPTLSHRRGHCCSEITTAMSLYLRRPMLANRRRVLRTVNSALSTTLAPVTYSQSLLPIICACR